MLSLLIFSPLSSSANPIFYLKGKKFTKPSVTQCERYQYLLLLIIEIQIESYLLTFAAFLIFYSFAQYICCFNLFLKFKNDDSSISDKMLFRERNCFASLHFSPSFLLLSSSLSPLMPIARISPLPSYVVNILQSPPLICCLRTQGKFTKISSVSRAFSLNLHHGLMYIKCVHLSYSTRQ